MNEEVTIVGFRNVSMPPKDGQPAIEGYTLYYNQDPDSDKVIGCLAGKQFINSRYVDYTPCLGDRVIFRYNKYGKICVVEVV